MKSALKLATGLALTTSLVSGAYAAEAMRCSYQFLRSKWESLNASIDSSHEPANRA